jgi:hypothetical protein
MTRHFTILLTAFLFFASASQVYPQKRRGPQLREDVDLPSDFSLDFQLATAERSRLRSGNSPLAGTEANQVGEEVFRSLVTGFSLPYRWTFSVTNSEVINAGSFSDGEVSVEGGMARLIGTNRGLWAAVLSHEIAHVARRHTAIKHLYRVYLNQLIAYYQARARNGDNSANWALLALRISGPLAYEKLSRNLEHDADIQGMMLMARAGYHPDNVFAAHHLLRIHTGESSKFAAFFQDHPRWETRDQRSERAYSGALAEYNRLWPDPDSSPGRQPPVVAFAGNPRSQTNNVNGTADLELPLYCRNVSEPLNLVIHFSKDKHPLQTSDEQYRDSAGNLAVRQKIVCLDREDAAPLNLHLPASLVSEKDRKTEAQVFVLTFTGEVLERFKSLDVKFPKSDIKASKTIPAPQTETAVLVQRKAAIEESVDRSRVGRQTADQHLVIHESPSQQPTDHTALSSATSQAVDTPSNIEMTSSTLGVVGSSDGVYGVKIVKIVPSSPAATAGLAVGDIIIAVDGIKVGTEQDLDAKFANREAGSKMVATIMHSSWSYNVTITMEGPDSTSDHSFGLLFPGHALKLDR